MTTKSVLLYCRAGFESDLSTEVLEKAAQLGLFGYPIIKKQSGYVVLNFQNKDDAAQLCQKLLLTQIVFARQMFVCGEPIEIEDTQDRVSAILTASDSFPLCGSILVEYPDTSEGRELSKLCRKITVPLRQALRKNKRLTDKEQLSKPRLHVFFTQGDRCIVGYSFPANRNPDFLGISRLKFPADAPSRSTLKLDEAFQTFIPKDESEQRLRPGLHAVDLGACPGGWTYQLVRRGMFVQAVDNGAMDEKLMDTGQVSYFPEDGFKYQPRKKNVYWLVCDMIEQPQRVAKLMATWLVKGWCKETVFNLKLPMKQRFESVSQAMAIIDEVMSQANCQYQIQAKHLYHDREEITVHIRLT